MRLQTRDFKIVVARAKKLAGSSESNTISMQAVGDHKLDIVSVAETSRLRQSVAFEGDALTEKPLYLDKTILSDMLATRLEEHPIDLTLEKGKVVCRQGEFKASLAPLQGTYLFETSGAAVVSWHTDGKWFSKVLNTCAVPIDKDAKKARGLLLDLRGEKLCVIGSDSFGPGHVHVFEAVSPTALPGQQFSLSKQSALFLADLELGNMHFEGEGRRMLAFNDNVQYRVSAVRNHYPDEYRAFFNLDSFNLWGTLNFKRSDLLATLAAVESVMSPADVAYRFSVADRAGDKLVVSISSKNDKFKSEASDRLLAEGNFSNAVTFSLRRGKVEASLKCMESEQVSFRIKNPDTPIVMTEIPDNGFRAVHLPLRSN